MGFSVVITPTQADLRRIVRRATRRLRLLTLVVGLLMSVAFVLDFSDGDGAPFLAGMINGFLGLTLLASAVTLSWGAANRPPSLVREPRTVEIDETGIRQCGSVWEVKCTWAYFRKARLTKYFVLLSREPGVPDLALPRSAFSPQHEAQLIAMLAERGLLSPTTTDRR